MQLLHKSRFNGHLEHKKDSGIDFLTSLIHYLLVHTTTNSAQKRLKSFFFIPLVYTAINLTYIKSTRKIKKWILFICLIHYCKFDRHLNKKN